MVRKITLDSARVRMGYTIKEAAKLFEVHPETISRWEKNPSVMKQKDVEKMKKIYKVDDDFIFFGDKNEFIRFLEKNNEDEVK
ncbi:helix-turn-helix transcriptional regulator [Enterococcus saccharolyticus]|uniref:helix-turn-helix domain-containing protein n=1 Tax=Enterococcus saccharolyticus TaxID=41997 RepID=UPI001E631A2B|nr:helix-turn-helix transcriptional regulator [Enterococcus saccharolyticus]MCD5001218.1 helix-turn-helix transcriptional regulator [Enterococcus saccharolyticus]